MTEKRIYVVVAETVDTPEKGAVVQIPGRMAAQGGHALSRMKMRRMVRAISKTPLKAVAFRPALEKMADEKITTIWLSCRDSNELQHIADNLNRVGVKWHDFEDENDEIYGTGYHPRTALATVPVNPDKLISVTNYLPLWKPEDFE